MRTPHSPQPTVNLGDDPDPGAELGQRLAAAAQTTQGLLTNYLFYGQRRQSDSAQDPRRAEAGDRSHDRSEDERRTNDVTRADRRREEMQNQLATPPANPAAGQGSDPVSDRQAADTRLTFRVVPQSTKPALDVAKAYVESSLEASRATADDAADAGAQWAQNDDNPATIPHIGGTNPHARGPRTADAVGDVSEQVGEEAVLHPRPEVPDRLARDGLAVGGLSDDPFARDPLAVDGLATHQQTTPNYLDPGRSR